MNKAATRAFYEEQVAMIEPAIHFHSSDDRFCGSSAHGRGFTLDALEVTCRDCQGRDTFVLSDEAAAYVATQS